MNNADMPNLKLIGINLLKSEIRRTIGRATIMLQQYEYCSVYKYYKIYSKVFIHQFKWNQNSKKISQAVCNSDCSVARCPIYWIWFKFFNTCNFAMDVAVIKIKSCLSLNSHIWWLFQGMTVDSVFGISSSSVNRYKTNCLGPILLLDRNNYTDKDGYLIGWIF